MGGHDAHHEPPYKIPNPDIYKIEDVPQLKRVQEELAKRGLRDPWLRNHVWRYKKSNTPFMRGLITLTRGWRIGVPAFLITIAVEQYFGIDYSGHGHHGDSHHGEDGHH
ncbi:NADH dehydrogenase [ubiquinone] 1 beta subcomplex subunit 3 [Monomorium pharaonis]|uniref:NADH dehydrogenase [ubiquinone] 1 beta subcomplex subunit 3 n=1 Tax=Monomorium pharaonis TaxID=307658 RepID=UPI00063F0E72|nr:NADH dehydrogenase [ubiquinone] 1 beta subcomplex subunit 3 [Monomorium pharaonis]XP_036143889.1 NADH dehydrogenase [ubiquinone] 1 beta subcomplex subunit 3 [Monomorium pharaonis]